jgi:hypothetical protein
MTQQQSLSDPLDELLKEEESRLPHELHLFFRNSVEHAYRNELNGVNQKMEDYCKAPKKAFEDALKTIERKLEE